MRWRIRRIRGVVGSLPRELGVALVTGIVAAIAAPPLVAALTEDRARIWVGALAALVAFLVGLVLGTALGGTQDGEGLKTKIDELEARTGELGEYEVYAEHVRDALGELRKVVAKELPSVSTRDFIEVGIFEPAHRLLRRDHRDTDRGDVRFSILVADGGDFVMADESGLLPAHGHHPESRQKFRLPIKDSFAGVTFNSGRVQSSNDLDADQRFKPHPKAAPAGSTGRWSLFLSGAREKWTES